MKIFRIQFFTKSDTVVPTICVERNRTDMAIYQLNTDTAVASAPGTVVHVFQMTVVYAMVIIMVAQQHILYYNFTVQLQLQSHIYFHKQTISS